MSASTFSDLTVYLNRWDAVPDGAPFSTATSLLVPVRHAGRPAIIKVAKVDEERQGNRLMRWWNGHGSATVLAHDDDAILMDRASGTRSLSLMASTGVGTPEWEHEDEVATRVLCEVALTLHGIGRAPESSRPPGLVPLDVWFTDLLSKEDTQRGFLRRSAATARELLASQRDVVVLHGDLHHGNVLDFGTIQAPAWRAIDPKFLVGERTFDFANILCNPTHEAATAPGRLDRAVSVIAAEAGVDRVRLLRWAVAWAGLSFVWHTSGGETASSEAEANAKAVFQVGRTAEGLLQET